MIGPKLTSSRTPFETGSPIPLLASQIYLPRSSFLTWRIVKLAPLEFLRFTFIFLKSTGLFAPFYLYVFPFEKKISSLSRFQTISGFGYPSALHNSVADWPSKTRTFVSITSKMIGGRVTCKSTSFAITLLRSKLIWHLYFPVSDAVRFWIYIWKKFHVIDKLNRPYRVSNSRASYKCSKPHRLLCESADSEKLQPLLR